MTGRSGVLLPLCALLLARPSAAAPKAAGYAVWVATAALGFVPSDAEAAARRESALVAAFLEKRCEDAPEEDEADCAKAESISTCEDLFKLGGALLEIARETPQAAAVRAVRRDCAILGWIRKARPARESHLHDYAFSEKSFEELPPCFGSEAESPMIRMIREAVEAGDSWESYSGRPKRFEAAGDALRVKGTGLALDILAKADFNDDGLEDMLVRSEYRREGALGATGAIVLTRKAGETLMRVVDTSPGMACPGTLLEKFPCPGPKIDAARERFAALFKKKDYRKAVDFAEEFRATCGKPHSGVKMAGLQNDIAVALYHLRDNPGCRAALKIAREACDLAYFDMLRSAVEFNEKLCADRH